MSLIHQVCRYDVFFIITALLYNLLLICHLVTNSCVLFYTTLSWMRNPVNRNIFEIWPSFPVESACLGSADLVSVFWKLWLNLRMGRAQAWWMGIVSQKQRNKTTKQRGDCALTRAGGALYTRRLRSKNREPDLSLSEPRKLGPVVLLQLKREK